MGSERTGQHANGERRRSRRVPLHWTLYLACNGNGHPVRTKTRDISSDGFYCLLEQPVKPGDQFACDIVVPTHNSPDPDDVVYLRCRAQAVRVEKTTGETEFGLACRIEDYCLVHGMDKRLDLQTAGHSDSAAACRVCEVG